ncbi:hypothetical protein PPYR_01597 [Photinus pyralis]|uniref:Myb/SANT-like DNA-binding domain-containing protein n=2 Tax=Photinus pyralis TaxID=7054 RepID=A0A5N4B4T6_PHOPY|nr:trihelix transcription factor GTL1-like isoform X2 [Photinus pyralis]XP_031328292.1 trihelix transcription factor GTL1-like isoform X2 [Photinus pyralis]XP_031328537.1 trihelix transcription factor GTL1-like isoform X2 [Photinus pyralis]XP_031329385.1 trihelix transcription factor GTL1-like isoform X2 [Photinus pyralis]XP_031358442.1 trihelix transcription factor GTL1-like isoform X2 [Photinus pyralis]XP_031359434.1 trihelix transcription factor GTL1-like isoform X2 [Photinus pyralis]KAB08
MELTLIDADTNKEFKLFLNEEDYNKAVNDVTFATVLLQHAIINSKASSTVPGNKNPTRQSLDTDTETLGINCSQELPNDSEDVLLSPSSDNLLLSPASNNPLSPSSDNLSIPINENDSENTEDISGRWSHEGILLLLDVYHTKSDLLVKGKIKQKLFWEQIASLINKKGYNVTAKQCQTKLATLKRQYKKIKDYNNTSGNDRKEWIYTEKMDELFGNKPWVEPVATASSSQNPEPSLNLPATMPSTPTRPSLSNTPQKTNSKKVVDILTKIREDRERHHSERMAKSSEAIALLKLLVEQIAK